MLTTNGQRESTQDLAAKVFAELRTLLLSFEEGALKGDVESIHDMRVTTRRFRVALSNFAMCVPLETRQRAKTDVNQLADTLGKVRDIDVMLDSLTVIEEGEPVARKPIIADLHARLTRRRKYHQQSLVRYLRSADFRELKDSLSELTNGETVQGQEDVSG